MLAIILAVLIFGVIIIVHEIGHFIAARANDILVLEFAIGMGPVLWKRQKGETLYTIRAFPIGGFCKMLGEDESNDNPRAFTNKKVWRRFIVSVSGALMNFALALIIAVLLVLFNGYGFPIIENVVSGSPAEAAGLARGDVIKSINGISINIYDDLSFMVNIDEGKQLNVIVERGGQKLKKTITPVKSEDGSRYIIGVNTQLRSGLLGESYEGVVRGNLVDSLSAGYYTMESYIKSTLVSLSKLITLQVGFDKLSGPIGVTNYIGEQVGEVEKAEVPFWDKFFAVFRFACVLAALMSANVGVFNLLPLPALDGGRCVFLIIEAIRRKPIDPNKEGLVHLIGFVALMLLAVFVAFSDVLKII